jgi:hypothetical protein
MLVYAGEMLSTDAAGGKMLSAATATVFVRLPQGDVYFAQPRFRRTPPGGLNEQSSPPHFI